MLLELHRISIFYIFYYYIYTFFTRYTFLYTYLLSCLSFITGLFYFSCYIEETLSLAAAIKAGAEEVAGLTRDRYLQRLVWLKEFTRFTTIFARDERKKTAFARITHLFDTLKLDAADGRIRKQPFCVLLVGPPGSGKTGTALKIAARLMKDRYKHFRSTDIVTLNETDEFQSEYRTNHKVVIFDDLGAENGNRPTVMNPWHKIVDFVNNIRKTSLNPNVELKGNVYIEPDLVIITTNRAPGENISHYMACPEAIIRRISACYCLETFTHCYRVDKVCPNLISRGNIYTTGMRFNYNCADYTARTSKRVDTSRVDGFDEVGSMITSLSTEFEEHMQAQEIYVASVNSILDVDDLCLSPWDCFYRDQIYPRLPKKVPLSPEIELLLPFYNRFFRMFCVPGEFAVAQTKRGLMAHYVTHSDTSTPEFHGMLEKYILQREFDLNAYLRCRYRCSEGSKYIFYNNCMMDREDVSTFERRLPPEILLNSYFIDLKDIDAFALTLMSKQDRLMLELKAQRTDFYRYHPDYYMWLDGFCKDPYVDQFLISMPHGFSLLAEEWGVDHEKGDLLLEYVSPDAKKFIVVVEIKTSKITKALKQALKFKQKLPKYRQRVIDFYPEMVKFRDHEVVAMACTRAHIQVFPEFVPSLVIDSWYDRFSDLLGSEKIHSDSELESVADTVETLAQEIDTP